VTLLIDLCQPFTYQKRRVCRNALSSQLLLLPLPMRLPNEKGGNTVVSYFLIFTQRV
jgi:hypothetical protein